MIIMIMITIIYIQHHYHLIYQLIFTISSIIMICVHAYIGNDSNPLVNLFTRANLPTCHALKCEDGYFAHYLVMIYDIYE